MILPQTSDRIGEAGATAAGTSPVLCPQPSPIVHRAQWYNGGLILRQQSPPRVHRSNSGVPIGACQSERANRSVPINHTQGFKLVKIDENWKRGSVKNKRSHINFKFATRQFNFHFLLFYFYFTTLLILLFTYFTTTPPLKIALESWDTGIVILYIFTSFLQFSQWILIFQKAV